MKIFLNLFCECQIEHLDEYECVVMMAGVSSLCECVIF